MALFQTHLQDSRDNRGKRHDLGFVVLSFFLSILESTSELTRVKIHRQMQRQHARYEALSDFSSGHCISYTQLGRILKSLDYQALNDLFEQYFGSRIVEESGLWYAIDGKELRGSIAKESGAKRGENVVFKTAHACKESQIIGYYHGQKEGEKSLVREYFAHQVKKGEKYSLDALHLSEDLLRQIHQQGGYYLIQLKGNQPHLLEDAWHTAKHLSADYKLVSHDKGHGREETRSYEAYDFPVSILASRWAGTGLQTLIKVCRKTRKSKTAKQSEQEAFYVSNLVLSAPEFKELCQAARFHWSVEVQNYQCDKQLGQDKWTGFDSNTQRSMAVFTNHALNWLNKHDTNKNLSKFREDIINDKTLIIKLFNQ